MEFGYKAQVLDNDDGVVLDHTVERGNPADAPQLAPAVGRERRPGPGGGRGPSPPTAATARPRVENSLHELGSAPW